MWILCKKDGLLGFIKCDESIYDLFGVVYLFIFIFVGFGFVVVCDFFGSFEDVICVVGDGVLIVGMVYEGFNNVGDLGK